MRVGLAFVYCVPTYVGISRSSKAESAVEHGVEHGPGAWVEHGVMYKIPRYTTKSKHHEFHWLCYNTASIECSDKI